MEVSGKNKGLEGGLPSLEGHLLTHPRVRYWLYDLTFCITETQNLKL